VVARRLAIVALVLAGCSPSKPGGFGVNVTVETGTLTINAIGLHVTGAEKFDKASIDLGGPKSGELRFHYVPGAQSGSLTFEIDGLDATGAVVGSGVSMPVTLVAGQSVDALVNLAAGAQPDLGSNQGKPCAVDSDCTTGHCTDGVCCDTACAGVCESCKLAATIGTCTAIPANTDPEQECAAKVPQVPDGGSATDDGGGMPLDGGLGMDGGLNLPDGGIMLNPLACGGTCSGSRSCNYPGASASCGGAWCNAPNTPGKFVCDGMGGCNPSLSSCTDYACNSATAACRTNCAADTDCLLSDYCNATNQCGPKKATGLTCARSQECQSGYCFGSVCCGTNCPAPQICNMAGMEGQCVCPGVTCAAGVSCQVYYHDADADGYGDTNGTIANGNAKAGCVGSPPTGFVADNSDCDDHDANAHPGQTNWYPTPSLGVGTFDYNCDGTIEKEYSEVSGGCQFCSGTSSCSQSTTCSAANEQSAFDCAVRLVPTLCCNPFCTICGFHDLCFTNVTSSFTTTVNCGASATLYGCSTCTAAGNGPQASSQTTTTQQCH
jgi:hypothetical protein